ncbi:hypothetical protein ACIRD3_38485 [Kitasatospora sp. NPDC093550]|uniref:hypothetical protein n=1 Tax=Kitasatospora sp. NPDC093550 TaxID=3364089 RepID=UPI00382A874D
MSLVTALMGRRRHRLLGRLVQEALALHGMDVPAACDIGPGLTVLHRGFGTVLHPHTTLGASTGPGEIRAGARARKVGAREGSRGVPPIPVQPGAGRPGVGRPSPARPEGSYPASG